jgi:hypothetical protein
MEGKTPENKDNCKDNQYVDNVRAVTMLGDALPEQMTGVKIFLK